MLTQLPEHYQTSFGDIWRHTVAQGDSRLRNRVENVMVRGKEHTFSYLGKNKMRKITTRNGKTIASDSPMAKRWLRPTGYDTATLIDEHDKIALGSLPEPRSPHVRAHAEAALRTMDEVILAAAEGDAYIGENGTDTVAVPSTQKVAVDYVASGTPANSGLTLAKLIRAKFILDQNEVPQEGRYFVHSAQQLQDLLNNVVEIKSSDYNNVKALVDGNVTRFMGFEFVMTELTTLTAATDVRTCVAYHRDGLALGIGEERSVKIDIRADLNHSIQIRTVMMIGAARLEEERVVLVYTDESP